MSTPAHAAFSVQQFLTQNSMIPPPYLPNPIRNDFVLFPWMNKILKRKRFIDVQEVKQKTTEALKGIKICKFKNCFELWKKHLDRCIALSGEYFEGD